MTRDEFVNPQDLAIVEKFVAAMDYLDPILQGFPRRREKLRDRIFDIMFDLVEQLYLAAKSKQASKLYAIDGKLAALRCLLRFAADPKRKIISHGQCGTAMRHLKEVGMMLGQWIKSAKSNGRSGS